MADELIKHVATNFTGITGATSSPQRGFRVVLFSRNSFIVIGLEHLLVDAGFAAPSMATDETSLVLLCSEASCRLAIIDGNSPIEQVAGTIRSLKAQRPHTRVLVVADAFDLRSVQMGLHAGASGFCTSGSERDVLIKSIELVVLGEAVLPITVIGDIVSALPQRQESVAERSLIDPGSTNLQAHRLSAREVEILTCLTKGSSNKVIARNLAVAEATVKVHIKAILRKIGAANRTQAAIWATEHRRVRERALASA